MQAVELKAQGALLASLGHKGANAKHGGLANSADIDAADATAAAAVSAAAAQGGGSANAVNRRICRQRATGRPWDERQDSKLR